jgi:chaperone modulatory protein CbpM
MMETREFLLRAQLEPQALQAFIEAGWLVLPNDDEHREFNDLDLARVRLIRELRMGFGVNDEGVGIVLHLLDQMHGMRLILRNVMAATAARGQERRVS